MAIRGSGIALVPTVMTPPRTAQKRFAVVFSPTHDRDRERRQERGVTGQDAETAAGILGAQANRCLRPRRLTAE
jgi:hypothetical protein